MPVFGVPAPKRAKSGVARRGQTGGAVGDTLTHAHISPQGRSRSFDNGTIERLTHHAKLSKRVVHDRPKPSRIRKSPPKERVDGGRLRFWVDGSLVKVSKPVGNRSQVGGGKRDIVMGFSRGSRRRILQKMAMLVRSVLPLFVTLTYPLEYSTDYAQWKKDLDTWCKRLHRRYPDAGLIWRLEAQRRGAPHFHLLIFGVELTPVIRQWIAQSWFEVVGSGDEKHLKHGADAQMVRSSRGVRSYVGKYIAKVQSPPMPDCECSEPGTTHSPIDWSKVGRWWGVRYTHNLPWSEEFIADGITYREAAVFMRYLRRYLKGQGVRVNGSLRGMMVYVNEPKRWVEVLDRLLEGGCGLRL